MTPPKPRKVDNLVLLPAPDAQHPLFRRVRLLEVADNEVPSVTAREFLVTQGASERDAAVVYQIDKVGDDRRGGILQLRSDAAEADERNLTGAVQVLDGVKVAERKLDFRLDYFVGGNFGVRASTNQKVVELCCFTIKYNPNLTLKLDFNVLVDQSFAPLFEISNVCFHTI